MVGDDEQLKGAMDSMVSRHVMNLRVCFFSRSHNDDILFNRPSLTSGEKVVIRTLD
jgi:hypothetical protein